MSRFYGIWCTISLWALTSLKPNAWQLCNDTYGAQKTDMKMLSCLLQQVPVHLLLSHSEVLLHQNGRRTATVCGPTAKKQGALTMWNIKLYVSYRYFNGTVFRSICGLSIYFSKVHTRSSMVPDSRLPPPSDLSVNTVNCWFLALSCNKWSTFNKMLIKI